MISIFQCRNIVHWRNRSEVGNTEKRTYTVLHITTPHKVTTKQHWKRKHWKRKHTKIFLSKDVDNRTYTLFYKKQPQLWAPNVILKIDRFGDLKTAWEFLNFGSYLVIFIPNIKKICIFFVFYRQNFLGSWKSNPEVSFFSIASF